MVRVWLAHAAGFAKSRIAARGACVARVECQRVLHAAESGQAGVPPRGRGAGGQHAEHVGDDGGVEARSYEVLL